MAYLSTDFSRFFKELRKNNTSAWFNDNRKLYEKAVKEPFTVLVKDLISAIQKEDPAIAIGPSDAITRINKDIRFSKDKMPYNTYVGAIISAAGKKDKSVPGLYIQLSDEQIQIFGGAYVLDANQLARVRSAISKDLPGFRKLYTNARFKKYFGEIKGEKAKRLDASLKEVAEQEPLITNKQFFFTAELSSDLLTSNNLLKEIMAHYEAAKDLNGFLKKALLSKK